MKSLLRYKISALLNIVGLGIALATAYVIGVQVYYTMTYNNSIPDSDRVFVLEQKCTNSRWMVYLSLPLGNAIGEKVSGVEEYGVCELNKDDDATVYINRGTEKIKAKAKRRMMTVSATKIMGVIAEEGSLKQLTGQNTIGISRSFADKWGLKIGDGITSGDVVYQIVCIFRDMPVNCTLSGTDVIGEFQLPQYRNNPSEWSYSFVYKLYSADGVDDFYESAKKVGMDASRKVAGSEGGAEQDGAKIDAVLNSMEMRLISMSNFYLYDADQSSYAEHSSSSLFYAFCVVFVVILLVAFSNFINFFMALVPRRIRSINTQKVFGYTNARLRLGLILESVVLVSVALLVAAVLVLCFIETPMSGYLNAGILFKNNMFVVGVVVVVALVLAVVASLYPAYYITSLPPAMSFKGSFGNTSRGRRFRMILLAFQFFVALSLIIASIFVCLQHYFMMNSDLGFNKEHLMSAYTPKRICGTIESRKAFEAKVRRNPLISDMAWADGHIVIPSRMGWGREISQDGKRTSFNFQVYPVSWNFLRLLNIPVTEGRDFVEADEYAKGTIIFNMSAKREFQLTLDAQLWGVDTIAPVVGFCQDIKYQPLKMQSSGAFAFYIFGNTDDAWRYPNYLYFRTVAGADILSVKKFVKDLILEVAPDTSPEDVEVKLFEDELSYQYEGEKRMSALLIFFASIAVVIALIGVFGLVLFDTQYRRREIAIRRVHGTSVAGIVKMYNTQYMKIVLCSFVPAVPLCYYLINIWLEGYAYHIPISWWVFAISLLLVAAVTLLIVTLRCLKAATENPVDSLKSE